MLDPSGITIFWLLQIEGIYEDVYCFLNIRGVRPRGSNAYFYEQTVLATNYFDYMEHQAAQNMHITVGSESEAPSCPMSAEDIPWDLVYIGPTVFDRWTVSLQPVCNGLAAMMATWGDNQIADYADNAEGHTLAAGVIYTINFTARAGDYIGRVSIDVLNNTHLDVWVTAYMGIYSADGTLRTRATPIQFLETLDTMVVVLVDHVIEVHSDSLFYLAVMFDHDYFVAQGSGTGPSMTYAGTDGLPATFKPDGVSRNPPIVAYGCTTASHYMCASFQYYQGDNFQPVAVEYLYQGLLLVGGANGTNSNGKWQSVVNGVGHLMTHVRIARYAKNFATGWVDFLLAQPGNATSNYIYTTSNSGATLDEVGLTFVTNDDFGYHFTLSYNSTLGRYVDSSDVQLGVELFPTVVIAAVDMSVGLPQCSFLSLPQYVAPESSLANSSVCAAGSAPVVWGSADPGSYFYREQGLFNNYYTDITLSPFHTGPTYSNVTQLALTLSHNANVFAHIRMALYLNNTLLACSAELTVDNPLDVTLYFTLNTTVTLYPASQYHIAMWTDVSLYMAAGWDYSGLCYYGITYGYDLQPWPQSIGSVEAEYTNCHPIPTAALGCAVPSGPPYVPPVDPNCPTCINCTKPAEDKEEGVSAGAAVVIWLTSALGVFAAALLVMWLVSTGRCSRVAGGALRSGQRGDDVAADYAAMH